MSESKRGINAAAQAEWEANLLEQCREAQLSAVQTEVVLLHLAEGMTLGQIRLKLHLQRLQEVKAALFQGCKKLAARYPECWDAARQFRRDLVFCAADRRDYDTREPGQRGVTPDPMADGYPRVRVMTADRRELRQDVESAVRLWAQSSRPAKVRTLADA